MQVLFFKNWPRFVYQVRLPKRCYEPWRVLKLSARPDLTTPGCKPNPLGWMQAHQELSKSFLAQLHHQPTVLQSYLAVFLTTSSWVPATGGGEGYWPHAILVGFPEVSGWPLWHKECLTFHLIKANQKVYLYFSNLFPNFKHMFRASVVHFDVDGKRIVCQMLILIAIQTRSAGDLFQSFQTHITQQGSQDGYFWSINSMEQSTFRNWLVT